jgi:hypothetical protein
MKVFVRLLCTARQVVYSITRTLFTRIRTECRKSRSVSRSESPAGKCRRPCTPSPCIADAVHQKVASCDRCRLHCLCCFPDLVSWCHQVIHSSKRALWRFDSAGKTARSKRRFPSVPALVDRKIDNLCMYVFTSCRSSPWSDVPTRLLDQGCPGTTCCLLRRVWIHL